MVPPPARGSSARSSEPRAVEPSVRLARFEDVVALARAKRDIRLVQAFEQDVRLARFDDHSIAFTPAEGAASDLAQTLAKRLAEWTGERWMVALTAGSTAPTLRETENARTAERESGAADHPVVRQVLERFKGARIVEVRAPQASAPEAPAPSTDDDVAYGDAEPFADDDF